MEGLEITAEDYLYRESFAKWRELLAKAEGDVAKVHLPSYIPAQMDDVPIGPVVTGALMAMLDHDLQTGGADSTIGEVCAIVESTMPPAMIHRLDEIILEQSAHMGTLILQSPLAAQRIRAWETSDLRKYQRWLKSLNRAARIWEGDTHSTLNDPLRRLVKSEAIDQLRLVMTRLQEWHRVYRGAPSDAEIIARFDLEMRESHLPWFDDYHRPRLLDFAKKRRHLLVGMNASPEAFFTEYAAFVHQHELEYTRKRYSTKD